MTHFMRLFSGLFIALSTVLAHQRAASAERLVIGGGGAGPVTIISPAEPAVRFWAEYLHRYFGQRRAVSDAVLSFVPREHRGTNFMLATPETLQSLGVKGFSAAFAPDAHPDSFILAAESGANGPTLFLVGKTASGVRSAVSRLICRLANDGRELSIESGREERSPFINIRLVSLAPSGRRQMPLDSPLADANMETWAPGRVRAYPELFAQFGFSGLQAMEIRGYGSISGEALARARQTVHALAQGAKDLGLFVSLDQWGDCPFVEGDALCWEVMEERAVLELFYEDLARRYGPLVDHVYVHVGDPGGATHDGCSKFVTPQKLTTGIQEIFRREHPDVQVTMSTWANAEFWKHNPERLSLANYDPYFSSVVEGLAFGLPIPEGATFLGEAWMPKEIGIALHRVYNSDQATRLAAAGRPVDVWGWYIGDMEMYCNVTLNMATVDKYYRDLPPEASRHIRMQTIELCFHGWPQIINSYMGAQKMWDPKRPREEIEREFCVAAFGPQNAEAMLALYRACENPWDYDVWGKPREYIPRPDDLGTPEGNARMRRVLDHSRTVSFPPGWVSNFAFPVPVAKYVEMLQARLELTIAYSEAKQKVEEVRRHFAVQAEASDEGSQHIKRITREARDALPHRPIDPLYRQDETVVMPAFHLPSWADQIQQLEAEPHRR